MRSYSWVGKQYPLFIGYGGVLVGELIKPEQPSQLVDSSLTIDMRLRVSHIIEDGRVNMSLYF